MPMKLAMLGMWHVHAHGLVKQLAAHPEEFNLVGCHDPDITVAEARAKTWGELIPGLRLFAKAEDLLAEPIDGVVVEGQVWDNLRLARLALESGRSVLLEKPAGVDFAEFQRLATLARAKHLHLQMLYLFRSMTAVQAMLKAARAGQLGDIYCFRARLPKDLPSYDGYVEELGRYGGGIFFEMAGHMVDIMLALLGKPTRVTPFMRHHHAGKPGAFIDNGVAVFEFPHALGQLDVSCLEVAPQTRRFEAFGTKGACVIPHLGSGHQGNRAIQILETYAAGDEGWKRHELPAATLQIADLREFAAVVDGRKPPDFSLDHDLEVQRSLLLASGMMT